MYQRSIAQTLLLLCTVCVSFVLSHWLGAIYQAEIIAFAFIVYVFVRRMRQRQHASSSMSRRHFFYAHILTLILLTIVLSTGGLGSPYFFLMYFLLFGIALLVEPMTSAFATLAIVFLFIPYLSVNFQSFHIVSLFSLPLMVPFALLMGSAYKTRETLIAQLQEAQKETSTVETDALMFVSTVVRTHVDSLIEHAQDYTPDSKMAEIRGTARRLRKLIDAFVRSYS